MLSTGTPFADSNDTNVCLISRGAHSGPSPAFSVSALNDRMTLLALSGVPIVEAKTRPWSCHSAPARSRSPAWRLQCSRSASTQRLDAAPRQRQGPPGLTRLGVTAEPLRPPDIHREPVLTFRPGIEPSGGDGLPPGGVPSPPDDVIPPQRPGLFGPDAHQQAQRHVRVHPRTLRGGQQRLGLFHGEALGRPARPASRRHHQRGDVTGHQIVGLSVPDRAVQAVAGDLQRPGGLAGRQLH